MPRNEASSSNQSQRDIRSIIEGGLKIVDMGDIAEAEAHDRAQKVIHEESGPEREKMKEKKYGVD